VLIRPEHSQIRGRGQVHNPKPARQSTGDKLMASPPLCSGPFDEVGELSKAASLVRRPVWPYKAMAGADADARRAPFAQDRHHAERYVREWMNGASRPVPSSNYDPETSRYTMAPLTEAIALKVSRTAPRTCRGFFR